MENSNVTPLHRGIVESSTAPASIRQYTWTASRRARQSEVAPISIPRGNAPLQGYANYSTRELARMCGVSIGTAKNWRRAGMAPAIYVLVLELLHRGPLELFSHEWADWAIRKGKLCNADGHEYTPGEVWSIPLLHRRIAALEGTVRELRMQAELADRFESQRDRSHRESKSIGKAEALCRVVFALLGELTQSEDGCQPALDGSSDLVRRLQLTACQVAIELHRGGQLDPGASEAAIEAGLAALQPPGDTPREP